MLTRGDVISGRYKLEESLGQGGFGHTYRALDQETGAHVAIKQLELGRLADWKSLELFEREARTLANLDHPRIPKFVNFIAPSADHAGFLVQELAKGQPLDTLMRSGKRFVQYDLELLAAQVLETLHYLHTLNPGVIHRDIKPANIIWDRENESFMVVDFGAVFELMGSKGSTVVGTFGYMAPEQFQGNITPKADLYGVGATLVALIMGKDPWELERERMKLSFREHVGGIDSWFLDWVERLIEPMEEDRFDSAKEALDALRDPKSVPTYQESEDAKALVATTPSKRLGKVELSVVAHSNLDLDVTYEHTPSRMAQGIAAFSLVFLKLVGIGAIVMGLFSVLIPWVGEVALIYKVLFVLASSLVLLYNAKRTPPPSTRYEIETRQDQAYIYDNLSAQKRLIAQGPKRALVFGVVPEDEFTSHVQVTGLSHLTQEGEAINFSNLSDKEVSKLRKVLPHAFKEGEGSHTK